MKIIEIWELEDLVETSQKFLQGSNNILKKACFVLTTYGFQIKTFWDFGFLPMCKATKGGFFFKECDSFFKSPNLQKKIFQKNYPELEI